MSDDAAMFVGIDVGKYQVDVALGAEGPVHQFKNDDEGIDQVLKLLAEHRIALVVMEASGGYQRQLLASLVAQKLSGHSRSIRDKCAISPRLSGSWKKRTRSTRESWRSSLSGYARQRARSSTRLSCWSPIGSRAGANWSRC